MKTVASLPPQDVADLAEVLGNEGIVCSAQLSHPQSGLDTTDLLVDDVDYERACDVIETWVQAGGEEESRATTPRPRCPKFRPQSWEQVEDADYERVELPVFRCKECGCLVPRPGGAL
jgi:hypothetical protein